MSYEEDLKTISLEASTDLSGLQYRFVDVNTDGELAAPSAGAKVAGVLQDKPAAQGRVGSVGIAGVSKVQLGGTLNPGVEVTCEAATGKAIAPTTGQKTHGVILEGGDEDDIVPMILNPNGGQLNA